MRGLVSRRDARIFRGSPDGLREIEQIHDEVFGQHDRGGWSQARFQRGIEKEKDDHLRHTVEALMTHLEQASFQRLILGGPREVVADLESKLHGYLAERLATASTWTWTTPRRSRSLRPRVPASRRPSASARPARWSAWAMAAAPPSGSTRPWRRSTSAA